MTRRKPLLAVICAALVALSLGLAACGDDDDSAADATTTEATPATTAPATPTPTETTPAAPAGGTTALTVDADPSGALAFTQKTLTAKPGEVDITFKNDAPVPHNIAVDGTDAGVSDTVDNGGTAELKITNLAAGTYEYYCDIPGHRQAGMVGTLTVQ